MPQKLNLKLTKLNSNGRKIAIKKIQLKRKGKKIIKGMRWM